MANNVMFKKGLQSSLATIQAEGKVVQDAFYLTTDTNRLYIGKSTNLVVPVSDAIHVVNTLPTDTTNLAGSIYYISTSNILAIRKEDNSGWVQINPDTDSDTQVEKLSVAKDKNSESKSIDFTITLEQITKEKGKDTTSALDPVTAKFSITDTDFSAVIDGANVGVGSEAISDNQAVISTSGIGSSNTSTVTIKGGDNVTLSGEANNITIAATDTIASMSSPANTTAIQLKRTGDNTTDTVSFEDDNKWIEVSGTTEGEIKYSHTGSEVSPTTGEAINVSATKETEFTVINNLTLDKNHVTGYTTSAVKIPAQNKLESVSVNVDKGTIDVQVKDSLSDTALTNSAENVLYYTLSVDGGTAANVYNQSSLGSFVSWETYQRNLKTIDALTYKGTIASKDALDELENVSIGDTYKASAGFGDKKVDNQPVYIGDLLIATGSEDETTGFITGDIVWTVVASGSDTDTTFELKLGANGNIILSNSVDSETDIIEIAGDEQYIKRTTDTVNGKITLAHKNDYTNNPIDAGAGEISDRKFNAVTSVVSDTGGHVTGYNVSTFELPVDNDTKYELAITKNNENNSVALELKEDSANQKGVLTLIAGKDLTLNTSDNNDTTIAHKEYAAVTAPEVTPAGVLTYESKLKVLTGVTLENGHVTGLTSSEYTLPASTHVTDVAVTNTVENNIVTSNVQITNSGLETKPADSTTVSSDSLTLSKTDTGYAINMVWGTF